VTLSNTTTTTTTTTLTTTTTTTTTVSKGEVCAVLARVKITIKKIWNLDRVFYNASKIWDKY
jgi:hypothetical protein